MVSVEGSVFYKMKDSWACLWKSCRAEENCRGTRNGRAADGALACALLPRTAVVMQNPAYHLDLCPTT